jgi:hypothetical protein
MVTPAAGGCKPILARVTFLLFTRQYVTEGVLLNARSQIWKLRTSCRRVVQNEGILLQNPTGGTVFRMAKRRQADHARATGHLDHRRQRLGCIAPAPSVFCQDVPGHGLL